MLPGARRRPLLPKPIFCINKFSKAITTILHLAFETMMMPTSHHHRAALSILHLLFNEVNQVQAMFEP
jgi:hypothetical protein